MKHLAAAFALAVPIHATAANEHVQSVHLELSMRLVPQTRVLEAHAALTCECGGPVTVSLGSRFSADQPLVDGAAARLDHTSGEMQQQWRIELPQAPTRHRIELRYRGKLAPLVEADSRGVLGGLPPMASERGSFLPGASGWYPELGIDLFTYRVELELPAGQRGLVAGRLMRESMDANLYRAQFERTQPGESIDLVAGPYTVEERASGDVRLRTYFHAELADLSAGYLDAAAGYVDRYSRAIGTYPYTGFSIASSALPTGFGMPSFTYLGIDVLRLPFIRTISLGHEVLHNWWGNGVYVDWQQGNWSEGLTTFMADYAYKEDEGESAAQEMRLTWLRDFAAVPAERDRPLREFT